MGGDVYPFVRVAAVQAASVLPATRRTQATPGPFTARARRRLRQSRL